MIRRRMLLAAALLPLVAACAAAGREIPEPRPAVAEPIQVVAEPNAQPDTASGVRCPVEGYCENVTRQVHRFFRAPAESAGASGEVCFRIQRDGSVTEITTQRVRNGGAAFRLALMEAAESAGSRRAFGTLPDTFDPARWRWCVELSPG